LEELAPSPALLESDPTARAQTRNLERSIELGVLVPTVGIVHNTRSPPGLPANPAVAEYFREQLVQPLSYLEERLQDDREFLAGGEASLADCSLEAALHFGRFNEMAFLKDHPRVQAWSDRYRKRAETQGILIA
jgi:glutathione S-transferase